MDLSFELEPGDDVVYVAEAVEQIERIETGLLALEHGSADESTLAEIFRAAHTLKGSAATIGHRRMAELTHALEEVFGALRDGRLHDLAAFGDLLLPTVDVLRVLVDEVEAGHTLSDAPGPLADTIVQRLDDALAGRTASAASGTSNAPEALDALDALPLDRLLAESLATDESRTLVRFAVRDGSEWAAVRLLQALMAAGETGRLLGSVPSLEEIDAGTGGQQLTILLRGTPADVAGLTERLEVMEEVLRVDARPLDELTTRPGNGPSAPGAIEPATTRRTAAHTIRIDVGQLDELMNLVGELIVQRTRLRRQARQLAARLGEDILALEAEDGARQFAQVVDRLQAGVTQLRMMPIETVFGRYPRLVHDLSAQLGKDVDLVLEGRETELDRSLLEEVGDPIAHLVRNALDHGIEPPDERLAAGKPARGRIRIGARHADGRILIDVQDDGRGMDPVRLSLAAVERGLLDPVAAASLSSADALRLVFLPGFSTAGEVTSVSGRGVGMDVVRTNVERLGGQVAITSIPGSGTTISMSLPLTLAIIEALLVRSDDRVCAIPLRAVVETHRVPAADVGTVRGRPILNLATGVVPLRSLGSAMGGPTTEFRGHGHVSAVLVRSRGHELALAVDEFLGTEEIVLKSLGMPGQQPIGVVGATILADGRVALVVDVDRLVSLDALAGDAATASVAPASDVAAASHSL